MTLAGSHTDRGARTTALVAAAWVALVCGFHYRQIWHVVATRPGMWSMLDGPRDPSLPHFGEALRVAVTSLSAASFLTVAATITGLTIIRLARWQFDGTAERVPVAATLGIGVLAYVGLGLAAIGAYQPWVLRMIVGVTIVAGIGWGLVNRRTYLSRRPAVPRIQGANRLWLAAAVLALGFAAAGALAPVTDYDAVWFHLHFPNVFLAHGRLVDLRAEYVSLYPMTWELWFGYGLAFGGPTTATLLHFATLPLTAMVVFALTRRYAAAASPWLAVALFVTTPTILWEATTPYVDLAFALHVVVMVLALLRYRETARRQWLILAALELGLALATKHVGLIVLAIACAGTLVLALRDGRGTSMALRGAVTLGAVSLLVPLPWYLRAWILTGDPVFPELFSIFGASSDRWDEQARAGLQRFFAGFGRSRTLLHQATLPWDMTMHAERYGGTLGPLFLALVPLAALRGSAPNGVVPATTSPSGLGVLALFSAVYMMFWASPIASFQMRWLLAATPALSVLAAAGFARASACVAGVSPRAVQTLVAALAVLLVLNLPPFTPLHEHERRNWEDGTGWLTHTVHAMPLVVVGAESRDDYLRRLVPTYAAWGAARRMLPSGARVLTWSGGDHLYAIESRIWVFAPAVRAAAAEPRGNERRALESIRQLGITHVLIDKQFLRANRYDPSLTWESLALTNDRTTREHYERLYEDDRAVVYRIRWDSVAR